MKSREISMQIRQDLVIVFEISKKHCFLMSEILRLKSGRDLVENEITFSLMKYCLEEGTRSRQASHFSC